MPLASLLLSLFVSVLVQEVDNDVIVSLKQNTLGTRDFVLLASDPCGSHTNSASNSLKSRLGLVVIILTPDDIDVHGDTSSLGEGLQNVWNHLSRQVTKLLALEGWLRRSSGGVSGVCNGEV